MEPNWCPFLAPPPIRGQGPRTGSHRKDNCYISIATSPSTSTYLNHSSTVDQAIEKIVAAGIAVKHDVIQMIRARLGEFVLRGGSMNAETPLQWLRLSWDPNGHPCLAILMGFVIMETNGLFSSGPIIGCLVRPTTYMPYKTTMSRQDPSLDVPTLTPYYVHAIQDRPHYVHAIQDHQK